LRSRTQRDTPFNEIRPEDWEGEFVTNPTKLGEIRLPSLEPEDVNVVDYFCRDAAFCIVGCKH
jgi:hypothetical protein